MVAGRLQPSLSVCRLALATIEASQLPCAVHAAVLVQVNDTVGYVKGHVLLNLNRSNLLDRY